MNIPTYKPEVCECCGQTKTYALAIDRGTVDIVRQIAYFIGIKGINAVHPRKEMEGRYLTSNQVGNLSRARLHGLIARVEGESGNYLLTRKGAKFLKGEDIPRIAIIKKSTNQEKKSNIGYFLEEEVRCTVKDFLKEDEYWQGINYTIEEGRIIRDEVTQGKLI